MIGNTALIIIWFLSVLRQFYFVSSHVTIASVGYSTIARITRLLAFIIPLKVILLAGSDGVPRYFRPFLSPEYRDEGIIVLSLAAIVSYAITLFLEARSRRLSESGSANLLAASGIMWVVDNQRTQARSFYARFTNIAAELVFALVGLMVLAVFNPVLVAWVLGVSLLFYLFTAWALHGITPLRRTGLSDLINERLGDYLGVLSSIAFLSAFLVILYPFVAGSNGNILVAIISVVLLRQVLASITNSVKDAIALWGHRQLVDTLVFPDRQLQIVENKDQRTLRDLFARPEREKKIAGELATDQKPDRNLRVEWLDPPTRGTAEFAITLDHATELARHFRQRVFPPRLRRMVENELLLFRHISRETVWAPPILHSYLHGDHECVIYEAGSRVRPDGPEWIDVPGRFLADLWSVEPPEKLVSIYSTSHGFLHQRLTDDFIARMDIAIDSDEASAFHASFLEALPLIRGRLEMLPLCLTNRGLRPENLVAKADGGYFLLDWGNWGLEPAGAGLSGFLVGPGELASLLEAVAARRPTMRQVRAADIELARQCAALEKLIQRGRLKAGLKMARQMMELPATEPREADADRPVPEELPGIS